MKCQQPETRLSPPPPAPSFLALFLLSVPWPRSYRGSGHASPVTMPKRCPKNQGKTHRCWVKHQYYIVGEAWVWNDSSISRVRTLFESKYSSASSRAAFACLV